MTDKNIEAQILLLQQRDGMIEREHKLETRHIQQSVEDLKTSMNADFTRLSSEVDKEMRALREELKPLLNSFNRYKGMGFVLMTIMSMIGAGIISLIVGKLQ